MSTIVIDAARDAGEPLDATSLPTTMVGSSFARESAPASRVLQQLAPEAWYVGEDGVTRLGRRAARDLTTPYRAEPVDHAAGSVRLASETIAAILPGVRVLGLEAVDVEHHLRDGVVSSVLWGSFAGASSSRRAAAYRAIVEQSVPRVRFLGVTEYRVVDQTGDRLDLQCVKASARMPDLRRVTVRPGVAGSRADLALGSRVLVAFVDADPARPVVVGFEEAEASGFAPDVAELSADEIQLHGGAVGELATEHGTSAEAAVNLHAAVLNAVALTIQGLPPIPLLPATLAALLLTPANAAIVNAAIATASAGTIAPYASALTAALAAKSANPTGLSPSLGWPNVRGA